MPAIDLNADLGEGFGRWTLGEDELLLSVITSANIACGYHAGDPRIMRRVCADAVGRGVAIGAQVGYRDLAGFGRREIEVDPAELTDEILYQVGALDGIARVEGGRVAYVKPHGALYHRIARDPVQAEAVAAAIRAYDPTLPLLTLPGSRMFEVGEGLTVIPEAFADRAYRPDGTLVPRTEPGAVLHDPGAVVRRAVAMAVEGRVHAVDGTPLPVDARSICVHGDTLGAVDLARALRAALGEAGVDVEPFT